MSAPTSAKAGAACLGAYVIVSVVHMVSLGGPRALGFGLLRIAVASTAAVVLLRFIRRALIPAVVFVAALLLLHAAGLPYFLFLRRSDPAAWGTAVAYVVTLGMALGLMLRRTTRAVFAT